MFVSVTRNHRESTVGGCEMCMAGGYIVSACYWLFILVNFR